MFHKRHKKTTEASRWQMGLLKGAELISGEQRCGMESGVWWLRGSLIMLGLVFTLRLFELQIVQGAYHLERAEQNRLVTRRLAPARGLIVDRNGEPLVHNYPTYKQIKQGTTIFQGIFEPISREQALGLRTAGEWVFFDISREYVYGRALSGVVGYVGEVSSDELSALSREYVVGDTVGKAGVEKSMDVRLRGLPGYEYVEVNSRGETVRTVDRVEPVVGQDVQLTVDAKWQAAAYEALDGYIGAAVAVDAETGEVLVLANRPAYDPNDIVTSINESDKPFFNRAMAGAYPPGSVYKPITLTAALEEGAVTASQTVEDTGEIRVNDFRFGNWLYDRTGGTEGLVDAVKAMQRSNDIYFYRIGEWLGPDKLAQWSRYFGLGSVTGISLPGETAGLIPDPVWKERMTGERWFLGNTYHMSIGQGDVQVTPLQMAMATAVVANDGRLCRPKLVADEPTECRELGITLEHLAVVRAGMEAVCLPGGTAARWATFSTRVACKTGTAQYMTSEGMKTHAWFTLIVPIEGREVVVAVLLEGAGEGSEHASPVAMKMVSEWMGAADE